MSVKSNSGVVVDRVVEAFCFASILKWKKFICTLIFWQDNGKGEGVKQSIVRLGSNTLSNIIKWIIIAS